MSQLENEQSLSMFFDSEFDSSNYVDALFESIITSNQDSKSIITSSSTYNKTNLNSLLNHLSNIITHLDYYTNELTQQLSLKIDQLNQTSTSIVSTTDSTNDITRLQYYINSFSNSIISLNTDIETIKINHQQDNHNKQPIDNLLKLKMVRLNLLNVLTILDKINFIISTQDSTAITIDEFEKSINLLYDTLKLKINQSDENNQDLINNINDLIQLLPLFQNLIFFYPIYKKFVVKLTNDLDLLKNS